MLSDFNRLKTRIGKLGNHHRKYTHFIAKYKDLLSERLEESGAIDEVHFWAAAPDLAQEMDVVCEMGHDEKERLDFLGCFFAFQLLNLNTRAVDVLRLGLASETDRYEVYRDFMLLTGRDLRRLTSAYMGKLLEIFLAQEDPLDFVICGVGTRADQDDLDLGIIDSDPDRRDTLNHTIASLQREMLRRAIPLHLHLSEHVGERSFSASVDEYGALLDGAIRDFIIITELLGARPIIGNRSLFADFTSRVTDRYYYDPGQDNRYHEGYLRGMMGEINDLLLRKMPDDSVHPKRDALRIIKGLLSARKTVLGIKEVNAWRILEELMARDPEHMQIYGELEDALSFIEVFRFLYQLLEVQEEKILLQEKGSRAQLEEVAALMGYRNVGVVRSYEHLLIHYHEHVQTVRKVARILVDDLRDHLERISVFAEYLGGRDTNAEGEKKENNIAVEFVETLRFFRGTRFWDDVMSPMRKNRELVIEFVDDFMSLRDGDRAKLVRRYAKWSDSTIKVVMQLLILLHEQRSHENARTLHRELSTALLDRLKTSTDVIPRVTALFDHYPKLLNDFLTGLSETDRDRFTRIFENTVWDTEVESLRKDLFHFCSLHCTSSHYFRRFLQRTVDRYPKCIRHLRKTEMLELIAKGFFARFETFPTFDRKRKELGSYYDLEFLRIGLECREGLPIEQVNAEFTEFVDNYLESLFDVCKQEVSTHTSERIRTRDLLAIYAAGGHGRKLAFDDDYDLVILLNSDDPRIRDYCGRIMTLMNSEIIKRGTMPQYRFAERFGHYVTTFSELKRLFDTPDDVAFIDMSQLLGARKIVGSKKNEAELYRQIIRPHILDNETYFTSRMADEIRSRHLAVDQGIISTLNIKETKGGLRDIELMLMILMARAGFWLPVTWDLQQHLVTRFEHRTEDLEVMFAAFRHLKHIRDIYHLTVAAEDDILPEEMGHLAWVQGYSDGPDDDAGQQVLLDDIITRTEQVADIVRDLLVELEL